ncbi:MAG: DUF1810 domain-containing protein [Ginsengibacter sp.]
MSITYSLQRFIDAQENVYPTALSEIRNGRKRSHWMWFVFPQIAGLGFSPTSKLYAIKNIEEAAAYLQHPVLGKRLNDISKELLKVENNNAYSIFGSPDDIKLQSSMTLFSSVRNSEKVFGLVLQKYFNGKKDFHTLKILDNQ